MNMMIPRDKGVFHQSEYYHKRLRLSKLLDNAMRYPLIVVCAGAGYGKTQSVHSFLESRVNTRTTWIQIGEWANTPSLFWQVYTERILNAWSTGAVALPECFPVTEEALAAHSRIIREMSLLPGKHVMVYDDFHLLTNPVVLSFIEQTEQLLPHNMAAVLISRSTPRLNLIRMMMDERIFTINEDNLRFTEAEINSYYSQLGLNLERRYIQDIWEVTRGWAFAVDILGRSLTKETRYGRHILEAMRCNIVRFIATELDPILPEALLKFLVRLSLLDHLAAGLLKTLVADELLLKEMEQISAYIRYDFYLDSYVMHHLFLTYLQQKQDILTDEEKRETYLKAAHWCEINHNEIDALFYYEKAEDYETILCLLSSLPLEVPSDKARHALSMLYRMPEDVKTEHPLFPMVNLHLNISLGLLEDASVLAEHYAKVFEARPESAMKYRTLAGIYGSWAFLRFILSPYTDVYDFDYYLKKQREYFDKAPYTAYNLYTNQSAGTYALLVGSNRAGAPEEYIDAMERSLPHILHVYNENLDALVTLARGELSFHRQNIDEAEKNLKQALEKARIHKQYDIQCRALFHLMYIAFLRGNFASIQSAVQNVMTLQKEKDYIFRFTACDIAIGFYYLMLEQADQVPSWLKGEFSSCAHPAFLANFANWIKAQYHYKTGNYSTLLAFIDNDRCHQTVLFSKIVYSVLEALALYQLKQRQQAVSALSEAYHLAAPNRITAPFVQYAKNMRTLTSTALRDSTCKIPREWLENINRKASAFAKKQARMILDYKTANDLRDHVVLTKREKDILADLSYGLSRSEIATSQNISVNTVKMAINIIYEKLHANNLAEAIRIASERKMI